MLQTILISSPLIAVFLFGLVLFVFGLRNYRFRTEIQNIDPNERTVTFIAFGAIGLAGSGSLLLFVFIVSRTIFFVLFLCGIILFLAGGITLRTFIMAGKEYVFSLSVSIIGMTLIALNFPLMISIHEPFTLIYAFILVTIIGIQAVVVTSWIKKRKHETSLSIKEQLQK